MIKHCIASGFQVCTPSKWELIKGGWHDQDQHKKEFGDSIRTFPSLDSEEHSTFRREIAKENYFPIGTMCVIDISSKDMSLWTLKIYEQYICFSGIFGVTLDRLDVFDVMKRYHELPSRIHTVTHEPYEDASHEDEIDWDNGGEHSFD